MKQPFKMLALALGIILMSGCGPNKTVYEIEEEIRTTKRNMKLFTDDKTLDSMYRRIEWLEKQKKELLRLQNNRPPEPSDIRGKRMHQLQAILDDWNVPPAPRPVIKMDWDAERLNEDEAKLMKDMVKKSGKNCTGKTEAWLKIDPEGIPGDIGILNCKGNRAVFYFIMPEGHEGGISVRIMEKSAAFQKYSVLETIGPLP